MTFSNQIVFTVLRWTARIVVRLIHVGHHVGQMVEMMADMMADMKSLQNRGNSSVLCHLGHVDQRIFKIFFRGAKLVIVCLWRIVAAGVERMAAKNP